MSRIMAHILATPSLDLSMTYGVKRFDIEAKLEAHA